MSRLRVVGSGGGEHSRSVGWTMNGLAAGGPFLDGRSLAIGMQS